MAVGHIKILGLDFTFVFRYRFEKDEDDNLVDKFTMWKDWKLGLFFRRMKIVGKKKFNQPKEWHSALVRQYMLGIDLLVCKVWVTVHRGGMEIKLK